MNATTTTTASSPGMAREIDRVFKLQQRHRWAAKNTSADLCCSGSRSLSCAMPTTRGMCCCRSSQAAGGAADVGARNRRARHRRDGRASRRVDASGRALADARTWPRRRDGSDPARGAWRVPAVRALELSVPARARATGPDHRRGQHGNRQAERDDVGDPRPCWPRSSGSASRRTRWRSSTKGSTLRVPPPRSPSASTTTPGRSACRPTSERLRLPHRPLTSRRSAQLASHTPIGHR